VGEIIVASERRVCLELVVAVEARLAACQTGVERCSGRCITPNAELFGDDVSIGQGKSKQGEQICEIVADIVEVLLRIHQLVVGSDTVMGEEVVVCGRVQTRASCGEVREMYCQCLRVFEDLRSADVILSRRHILVRIISKRRHLVASLALSGNAILRSVVRILGIVWCGRFVISIEWTGSSATCSGAWLLAAIVACSKHRRVNTLYISDPWKGRSGGDQCCEDSLLHDCLVDWDFVMCAKKEKVIPEDLATLLYIHTLDSALGIMDGWRRRICCNCTVC
jgi:hypothetical protein